MKSLQERFAAAFPPPQRRGLRAEIARVCSVKPPTVTAWFDLPGKVSTIDRTCAEELCKYYKLDIAPAWLAEGKEPKRPPPDEPSAWDANTGDAPDSAGRRSYPVISSVQAGEWSEIIDDFQPGDADEWVESPKDLGPRGFILRIKGDSMTNPDGGKENFPSGISVHIRPETDAEPGDFVVAKRVTENEATFKKLVRVDGDLYLHAINPSWPKPYVKLEPGDKIIGKLKFAGWDF